MTDVFISYNPYKVLTKIEINSVAINEESKLLESTEEHRLQTWIEPHGAWKGIFKELRDATGDKNLQLRFHGTAYDFNDLKYASEKYGSVFESIALDHINADSCKKNEQTSKLAELKKLYKELLKGPIDEFKAEDIQKNFEAAINSDFEIIIVAPMSSGKSTLINSLLHCDLLPAFNEATTAIITRIRDNDKLDQFIVSADSKYGSPVSFRINPDGTYVEDEEGNYILDPKGKPTKNVPATAQLIHQLNYAKDPSDKEGKNALINETFIEGPIPSIPSDKLNTVFVDTPGGNNSQNEEHTEMMDAAIENENKSLILYVFNGTQTGTNDSNVILEKIATEMKKSNAGKQSRDRFLFVANRMDDFDPEREDYQKYINSSILPMLKNYGITEPNLFLVSAQLAKLIRMQRAGQKLTKNERAYLSGKLPLFGSTDTEDDSYSMYKFSAISDKQKAAFDAKIAKIAAENEDEYEVPEIAEINSGIPALEAAITDYVEKYAVSIKVKTAHDTFMRKVKDRHVFDTWDQKVASSKEELEAVREEISKKKKEYSENETLQQFKNRINEISFDDSPFASYSILLRHKLDEISHDLIAANKGKIKKEDASAIIKQFRSEVANETTAIAIELDEAYEEKAIIPCNIILAEYTEYVNSLENKGMFNLGGINITKLSNFKNFAIESAESMLTSAQTFNETTKHTRRYKKSGFWNSVKRFFGSDSGWGTEYYTETVTYVDLDQSFIEKINSIITLFDKQIQEQSKHTKLSIEKVKEATADKLDGIDQMVKDTLSELEKKVKDEVELKKKVEQNKKNFEWLEKFIADVNAILEV